MIVGTVAEIPSVIIALVTQKSLRVGSDDDGSEVGVVVVGPLVGGAVCVDGISCTGSSPGPTEQFRSISTSKIVLSK